MKSIFLAPLLCLACAVPASTPDDMVVGPSAQDNGVNVRSSVRVGVIHRPCSTNVHLVRSGARILSNVRIVNLFMGHDWAPGEPGEAMRGKIDAAWQTLAPRAGLYAPLVEYASGGARVGVGSFGGSDWVGFGAASGDVVAESLVQAFVDFEIDQHRVEGPIDDRTLYLVYLGTGAQSRYDKDNGFSGHHRWYERAADGRRIHYAAIDPQGDIDAYVSLAYHEIGEAITDPDFDAFTDTSTVEGEVGDLCQGASYVTYAGYRMQPMWSQQQCSCAPPSDSVLVHVPGIPRP